MNIPSTEDKARGEARRSIFFILLLAVFLICPSGSSAARGIEGVEQVEARINGFLKEEDTEKLKELLPEKSRIFLSLEKIKNVKGFFSADQTLLIFKEFFEANTFLSLAIERNEGDDSASPLFLQASLTVKSRESKIETVLLNFLFLREDGSWRLKEIKEAG